MERLDSLIDELVLASRLDALDAFRARRPSRARRRGGARYDAGIDVTGEPVELAGDPGLLRRLMHNLFDDAERHAAGEGVRARSSPVLPEARVF